MSNSGGGATILVFEDSQAIDYPTIHYDIRNETYSFTLHLRVIHDERANNDINYGKNKLRNLYLILRKVLLLILLVINGTSGLGNLHYSL